MSDNTPLPPEAYKVLADVLGGSGKVIAYRPYFAHVFGGACNALLLSQFWYWTNTSTVSSRSGDGWFWKSQKEITQETGLTRTEILTTRRKLTQLGVLEEDVRGVPATVHFRVVKDVLFEVFWRYILANPDEFAENLQSAGWGISQFAENLQTRLPNTRKLVRGKRANKNAEKLSTILKTTSEKTQKNTQRAAPAGAPETSASLFQEEDTLDQLPPDQWAVLEAEARARVIAEKGDPIRTLARQGKAVKDVKIMMRQMLAERARPQEPRSLRAETNAGVGTNPRAGPAPAKKAHGPRE